jgi:hypothetical protein
MKNKLVINGIEEVYYNIYKELKKNNNKITITV